MACGLKFISLWCHCNYHHQNRPLLSCSTSCSNIRSMWPHSQLLWIKFQFPCFELHCRHLTFSQWWLEIGASCLHQRWKITRSFITGHHISKASKPIGLLFSFVPRYENGFHISGVVGMSVSRCCKRCFRDKGNFPSEYLYIKVAPCQEYSSGIPISIP